MSNKINVDNIEHHEKYIFSNNPNLFDYIRPRILQMYPATEIKQSNIQNAGDGLFATRDISNGALITNCIHHANDGLFKTFGSIIMPEVIQSNSQTYEDLEEIKLHINARKIQINNIVYLQAIKPIYQGEEILIYYGLDYWIMESIMQMHSKANPLIVFKKLCDTIETTKGSITKEHCADLSLNFEFFDKKLFESIEILKNRTTIYAKNTYATIMK